jgi:uncharacterized damage-inducible protein DinB
MISERDNYHRRLEDLRSQVILLVTGLSPAALNWRPFEPDEAHAINSLAALAAHIAGAEHFWIAEVIGGRPATRNRDQEFATMATDAADLVALLDRTASETRDVFAALKDIDLDGEREVDGKMVPIRWGLLHLIDHTALHLGHMQLTYQLWMGGQGAVSPLWFERFRETLGNS